MPKGSEEWTGTRRPGERSRPGSRCRRRTIAILTVGVALAGLILVNQGDMRAEARADRASMEAALNGLRTEARADRANMEAALNGLRAEARADRAQHGGGSERVTRRGSGRPGQRGGGSERVTRRGSGRPGSLRQPDHPTRRAARDPEWSRRGSRARRRVVRRLRRVPRSRYAIALPWPRTLAMKTQESFGEYTRRIYRLPDMDQRPQGEKRRFFRTALSPRVVPPPVPAA